MRDATRRDRITCSLPEGDCLELSLYGGQLLSWRDATGRELLYLSAGSTGANGKPVRGGIPVCFPQFAARGPLPKHGLARTANWTQVDDVAGDAGVHLQLREQPQTLAVWPHRFALDLWAVMRAGRLRVSLRVLNTDQHAWTFTAALHTYFRVGAITETALHGLQGTTYEDALRSGQLFQAQEDTPDFSGAIDRIYHAAPNRLLLRGRDRFLEITQQGFADTVVWNPGPGGAAGLGDMPAGDESQMLCVEAAQVVEPIELRPGESWQGSQETSLR